MQKFLTLAFLFFIVLLLIKKPSDLIDYHVIKATIHMIVASNMLSLSFRALDKYTYLVIFNTRINIADYPGSQKPYSWLYTHKSQYAFLLVLSVAFFSIYRKYFRNIFTYCVSQGILLVALYFSDTYTSMAAVLFIFAGQFLTYWWKTRWYFKLGSLVLVPFSFWLVTKELLNRINTNRNLLTLGSRTLILESFAQHIQNNPNGIGAAFGSENYFVTDGFSTSNCHNIFMNHMFRFSIPVGTIYIAIIVAIILYSFIKNFSFMTLGIWIALLIPLSMDYALLTAELPFTLFILYCIFFKKTSNDQPKRLHLFNRTHAPRY